MADLEFDRDVLEAWLNTQPWEVSLAIAARTAMRVFPITASLLEIEPQERATAVFLPILRSMAVQHAAVVYPARREELRRNGAVYAAANADTAARAAARSGGQDDRALAAVYAAATAAQAVTYAADAARAATYAAAAANAAVNATAKADSTARALQRDREFIETGSCAADLAKLPLWHGEKLTSPIAAMFFELQDALAGLEEDWDVWIFWYSNRILGIHDIEDLEIARLALPEEIWEQGPKVVNAEIKRLEEEYRQRLGREDIDARTGGGEDNDVVDGAPVLEGKAAFVVRGDKLDYDAVLPGADEETDPTLAALLSRLQQRLDLLRQKAAGLHNQHPVLAQTLVDYHTEIANKSTRDIDVLGAWMTGAGLVEQVRAHGHNSPRVMGEPLEPELDGLLREICRLHAAFIMGFEQGEALARRSGIPLLDRDEWQALLENQRFFVARVLEQSALSENARRILGELDHTVLNAGLKIENAAEIAFPVVRDVLLALGRFARRSALAVAGAASVGLADGMATAWLMFLQENMGPVIALAASQPELRDFFDWYYAHLEEKTETAAATSPSRWQRGR